MSCHFHMIRLHNRHQNMHIVNNHYCGIEDVKSKLPSQESNPPPCAPHLAMASDSSGLIFLAFPVPVVAEWWNVCTGTPHSCGHLSSGPHWTRPITRAPLAQTAASHSLDYSTALPVAARIKHFYVGVYIFKKGSVYKIHILLTFLCLNLVQTEMATFVKFSSPQVSFFVQAPISPCLSLKVF